MKIENVSKTLSLKTQYEYCASDECKHILIAYQQVSMIKYSQL